MKCLCLFLATVSLATSLLVFPMDSSFQIPITTDTIKIIKSKLAHNDLVWQSVNDADAVFSEPELHLFTNNHQQLHLLVKIMDEKKAVIDQITHDNNQKENIDNMTLMQAMEYFKKLHKLSRSEQTLTIT